MRKEPLGEFIKGTIDAAGEMLIKAKRVLRVYEKGAKRLKIRSKVMMSSLLSSRNVTKLTRFKGKSLRQSSTHWVPMPTSLLAPLHYTSCDVMICSLLLIRIRLRLMGLRAHSVQRLYHTLSPIAGAEEAVTGDCCAVPRCAHDRSAALIHTSGVSPRTEEALAVDGCWRERATFL